MAGVAPGGAERPAVADPASGCVPSGGFACAPEMGPGESAGTMRCLARRLVGPRKPIGEYFALARCFVAGQSLIHDVVAALRIRGAIPRTMKGDEQALLVVRGKLLLVVEHHAVGCPMRGKVGRGPDFQRADAGGFS